MENLKITHHQEGDYLIPDLVLPKRTTNYQIGKYGYLRLEFLKEHKRGFYCELNLKNELNKHLIEVDKESNIKVNNLIYYSYLHLIFGHLECLNSYYQMTDFQTSLL